MLPDHVALALGLGLPLCLGIVFLVVIFHDWFFVDRRPFRQIVQSRGQTTDDATAARAAALNHGGVGLFAQFWK